MVENVLFQYNSSVAAVQYKNIKNRINLIFIINLLFHLVNNFQVNREEDIEKRIALGRSSVQSTFQLHLQLNQM